MAYDWSGNQTTQQRYDKIVLTVAGAIFLTVTTGTILLRAQTAQKSPITFANTEQLNSENWHLRL